MGVVASVTEGVPSGVLESLAGDAQHALDVAEWGEWELSLLLCDDAFITPLNKQWRDKDGATDVLSFPQLDLTAGVPAEPGLLGDIVISLDAATRQAAEVGNSVEEELRVLLVHGLCHLVGHTHGEDDDSARMAALEARVLTGIGCVRTGLIGRTR